jgi:hypothetical protein
MHVSRKPAHIMTLQSREARNKIAHRGGEKSFAEISDAMHRHSG